MQIVVTGLIATYPLGGLSWDYIQYIQGLHLLGHDVFYLEDTGNWVYNPELSTFTGECSFNLQYLDAVLTFGSISRLIIIRVMVFPQPDWRIFRTYRT